MSAPARRKLAAIVFADIVGYTDKTQRDESGTLNLRDRIERLVKASTLGHNGRVVKTLGDGAMLEFASAVEAVSCAIDIQDQMSALNLDLELSEPIALRVGVHVGDVVEEADDLYGNAVNIASRVLGMAKPGGICITREVYVQIRPILKLSFEPVAGATSDRLPEPVEVFAIVGGEDLHPSPTPRAKRRNPVLLAAGALAGLTIIAALYTTFDPGQSRSGSSTESVHRILLPDWVTPGEWFVLDAGSRSAQLTVYFGNRKADTRVENQQLFVRTPIDLPTAQTAVSVFEGKSPDPLLNQQTQVIKYGSLAMNKGGAMSTDPLDLSGPAIDISPGVPIDQPKSGSEIQPKRSSLSGSKTPSGLGGTQSKPKAGGKLPPSVVPETKLVRIPPPPEMENYEAVVNLFEDGDFRFERIDMKDLRGKMGALGDAMKSVGLAQSGESREARQIIQSTRLKLSSLEPDRAKEVEALLKTAEAFLDEPMEPRSRSGLRRPHPKWAEAFAYSMNKGTRNMPGLIMIDHQLRAKDYEGAKRALLAMKSRPDLTPAEAKAIEGLEARLAKGNPKSDAPQTDPGHE